MKVEFDGWQLLAPWKEARASTSNPAFHGINYTLYMVVHHRVESIVGDEGEEDFFFNPKRVRYACPNNLFKPKSGLVGECRPCHHQTRLMKVSPSGGKPQPWR